jgi:hypothetical protein
MGFQSLVDDFESFRDAHISPANVAAGEDVDLSRRTFAGIGRQRLRGGYRLIGWSCILVRLKRECSLPHFETIGRGDRQLSELSI